MHRYVTFANVTAVLALVVALAAPVWASPVTVTAAASPSKRALKIASKADRRSKRALAAANRALARTPQNGAPGTTGPTGGAGPKGDTGATGPSTGPAGGDLAGSYPDPLIGAGKVTPAKIGTTPTVSVSDNRDQPGNAPLRFGLENFDVSNMHAAGGDSTRLTAPIDGIYQVSAQIQWTADGDGGRFLYLVKNAATVVASDFAQGSATIRTPLQASLLIKLAAGDFVQASPAETSLGSPEVYASCGTDQCLNFSMYWVGPR